MKHIALNLHGEWLLQRIVKRDNRPIAEFTWKNTSEINGETLVLQCHLTQQDFQYLNRYQKDLALKRTVKVIMTAHYVGFVSAYSGQTPECPAHMLTFEAVIEKMMTVQVEQAVHVQPRQTSISFAA